MLLARALAVQSQVLLMDEPLANLDAPHQADWLLAVRELVTAGKTVVSVLHELGMALHSDQLLIVRAGRVAGDADVRHACRTARGVRAAHFPA